MRLTLRTLLSWKDGMLDDAAATALGERVAASPPAGQLHDRIGEVVARQMLSAPAPEGSGLAADANSTAEYLDNVMPVERIEEFERICFGSDMLLAEVAGCHEMLAELAKQPRAETAVDRATVARLVAVVRAAERHESGADRHETAGRADRPRVRIRRRERRPADGPKRASTAAWLMAFAAVLLLAALLGVLGWSLVRGGRRAVATRSDRAVAPMVAAPVPGPDRAELPPAVGDPHTAPAVVPEPPKPEPPKPEPPVADPPAGAALPRPANPEPSPPAEPPPAGTAPAAPPAPVAVTPPASPSAAAAAGGGAGLTVPYGDALAIAARPAEPAAVVELDPGIPADGAARAPAAADPATDAAVVAGAAPLLVRAGAAAVGWETAGDAMPVALPADLLAPAAGVPACVIDEVRVVLGPGTRAGITRSADGMPRLEVVFGSVVVAAANGQRLGVAAGGLQGTLEACAGPVAIDVSLERTPGAEPGVVVTRASIVAADAVTFVPEDAADRPAAAGIGPRCVISAAAFEPAAAAAALRWSSAEPGTVRLEPLAEVPHRLSGSWPTAATDREAAASMAARLGPGADVVEALRGLAADRRGENRSAAVATLALLGDFAPLAEQLCTEDPRRVLYERQWRRLATEAVPLALARGVNAATRFRAALVAAGPPGGAAELVPLADGFSDDELAAGADARLVAALESPHLVVRRWALANLVEIVRPQPADESRYRADASDEARRKGVDWWRGLREQGRIRRAAGAAPQPGEG